MTYFAGIDAFSDGHTTLMDQGRHMRHDVQSLPGVDGGAVTDLGQSVRSITQRGELLADTAEGLESRFAVVEEMMDGRVGQLEADDGRVWDDMMMTQVKRGRTKRVGVRWSGSYEIQYLQTHIC